MALTVINTGDPVVATNIDQYHDVLTGVMTDQVVTLGNDLVAQHGVKLGAAAPVAAGPDLHSDGTNVYLETASAGTLYLRPNGPGNTTNQASYDSTGKLTVAGSLALGNGLTVPGATTLATLSCTTINTGGNTVNCGGLTATTGTFSGALSATSGSFSAGLTTSGAVTHNSVGSLVLAGANTFTGGWSSAGIQLMVNVNGTAYLVQLGH